jgi:fumarate hydratase class II
MASQTMTALAIIQSALDERNEIYDKLTRNLAESIIAEADDALARKFECKLIKGQIDILEKVMEEIHYA